MATATAIINRFIDETQVGLYGSATGTFAATTLTDTSKLQNSNYQGNEFRGYWLGYLDSVTVADREKPVASNGIVGTTGVLTHGGSNITTTGGTKNWTLTGKQWPPVRYLVPLLNRALELCYTWWREPLSTVANAGGEASSVGGSDSSATTTRNTTASTVFDGQASLRVANSGANGYHQFADSDAAPNRAFTVGAWVRIASGTAVLQVIGGGSVVQASVTATGTGFWQYLQVSGTFSSSSSACAVRIGGQESTADTYWDNVCLYWEPVTRITGPSWVTQWRDQKGHPLFRLLRQDNRIVYDGTAPGRAYDWRLIDEGNYQVINSPAAANPVEFEIDSRLTQPAYPIIIEARRSYASLLSAAIAAGTDTTDCPIPLAVAAMKRLAANDRRTPQADKEFGGNDAFKGEWEKWQAEYASQLVVPPVGSPSGLAWRRWGR